MGATEVGLEATARPTHSRRRVVVVADNSLIVEAICIGFRKCGEFDLVGHADGRSTPVTVILGARPHVVLLDDMGRSGRTLELIGEFQSADAQVTTIVLSVAPLPNWIEQLFEAGAAAVLAKETHPAALATLVRETLDNHIVHLQPLGRAEPRLSGSGPATADRPLTARELEILRLVASGTANSDIAKRLWVTEQTVKFHLRNVYRKLNVSNRTQASHFAHLHGLISTPTALESWGGAAVSVAT
jgi:DNA-binding NarL/FixJ family response regulator